VSMPMPWCVGWKMIIVMGNDRGRMRGMLVCFRRDDQHPPAVTAAEKKCDQ